MTTAFLYQPPTTPLELLFQDKDLLVVNKPSGLLTNPGKGAHLSDCLLSRVQAEFPTALLVHRLDMATSGLVVFALRRKAEATLKQQFASRTVKKTYLARVHGTPANQSGYIDAPLIADLAAPPRNKVCFEQGKAAQTYYQLLPEHTNHGLQAAEKHNALLALFPLTGRAHQLRVHLLHLGYPILGDALYGPPYASGEVTTSASRLLLHAMALEIQQPYSGEPLQFLQQPDLAAFGLNQPLVLPVNPYR
jgi:tRNA pseudouridine32 synthase/23S rRNA pseudouridine746 synthase